MPVVIYDVPVSGNLEPTFGGTTTVTVPANTANQVWVIHNGMGHDLQVEFSRADSNITGNIEVYRMHGTRESAPIQFVDNEFFTLPAGGAIKGTVSNGHATGARGFGLRQIMNPHRTGASFNDRVTLVLE